MSAAGRSAVRAAAERRTANGSAAVRAAVRRAAGAGTAGASDTLHAAYSRARAEGRRTLDEAPRRIKRCEENESMSSPERSAPRRARPSGRAARPKARATPPAAPPYITRSIPPYALLSDEGLEQVERHADQLLEEIGFE